jgi:20S proteasome alpha/beta subunit
MHPFFNRHLGKRDFPLLFGLCLISLHLCSLNFCSGATFFMHERHAFSLTVFDPRGKLTQVEYAMVAASMGTPIVACVCHDKILLAAPQLLPSPFLADDGTPRFTMVAPHLIVGHSGIAADGRVVMEAAQRLAIEHTYTFDEPMPLSLFLEELSLLFQEYTMKPMARPFGCTLLVGYLPASAPIAGTEESSQFSPKPRLFRIDCSGSVSELNTVAILHGTMEKDDQLQSELMELVMSTTTGSARTARESMSRILSGALERMKQSPLTSSKPANNDNEDDDTDEGNVISTGGNNKLPLPLHIIAASFDRQSGLAVERRAAT